MAIASASYKEVRRLEQWARLHGELAALHVPREAWPQRLPPHGLHTYIVRNPGGIRIQVLLTARRFLIPSQDIGARHSVMIPFGEDAAGAWEAAKRRANWQ